MLYSVHVEGQSSYHVKFLGAFNKPSRNCISCRMCFFFTCKTPFRTRDTHTHRRNKNTPTFWGPSLSRCRPLRKVYLIQRLVSLTSRTRRQGRSQKIIIGLHKLRSSQELVSDWENFQTKFSIWCLPNMS